jgi:sulfur carrier protein ThiS
MAVGDQLRLFASLLAQGGFPNESLAAARQAESVLRAAMVGEPAELRWRVGLVVVLQFEALVALGRSSDAAAAAVEAVEAFGEAAAAGTEPMAVGDQLRLFASLLAQGGFPNESLAAARQAESVLRVAMVGEPAELRWRVGLVVVLQFEALVALGRSSDAATAAVEAVEAFAEAAAAGTEPQQVVAQLRLLASRLMDIDALDEAAAALNLATVLSDH